MRPYIKFLLVFSFLFFCCVRITAQQLCPVYPKNNTVQDTNTVHFIWNRFSDPNIEYDLQIAEDSLFSVNVQTLTSIEVNDTVVSGLIPGNHFWRVRAFDGSIYSPWSKYYKFYIFDKDQISGLTLWLKANKGVIVSGSSISQWEDQSGNSNHASQSDFNQRPTLVNDFLNHNPVVRFDGSNDLLNGVTIPNLQTSSISIFMVTKGDNQNGVMAGLFDISSYTNGFCFTRRILPGYENLNIWNNNAELDSPPNSLPNSGFNFKLLEGIKNYNTKSELFINCVSQNFSTNTTLNGAFTNGNYIIGFSQGWNYLKGDIAEIILYNTALSPIDRLLVEKYLRDKYAPPVNLGEDIQMSGFCDTLLDAGDGYTAYLWSTGSTSRSVTINQTGTYWVKTTDLFGIFSYDTVIVNYPKNQLKDTVFCSGDSVILSTGLPDSYTYLWSNGESSPTLTTNTSGFYSVTVTDGNSCSFTSNIITVIEDTFPLNAKLGNDTNLCSGNFIGLVSPNPLPPGLTYNWSTSENTFTIAVSTTGNYSVTVTDSNGCIARDTILATIMGSAPQVLFNFSNACSGSMIQFNNASVPIGNTWNWDFGDGQSSTSNDTVFHLYSNTGNYIVRLTVSDSLCTSYKDSTIVIKQGPKAAFNIKNACINHSRIFYDNSDSGEGSIIKWDWDFGDGSAHSNLQNPQHIFNLPGDYMVTLTILTDVGCQDSISHPISVVSSSPSPSAFSLYSPTDDFVTGTPAIDFAWNSAQNAESYTLEYSTDSLFNNNVTRHTGITTNQFSTNIIASNKIYWRVFAYSICNDSITSDRTFSISVISPALYTGLSLWLKADSVSLDGTQVSQAFDCSGNNYHALQASSSNQPLLVTNVSALNQLPVIHFDGSNDYLNGMTIPNLDNSSICIFIIASGETQSGVLAGLFDINNYLNGFCFGRHTNSNSLSIYNNSGGIDSPPNSLPNSGFNYSILEGIKVFNTQTNLFINGINKNTSSNPTLNGPFTNAAYVIGHSQGWDYFKGSIAEIIVYKTALIENDRKSVESYLRYKYAPPVNLGPDITIRYGFCDTTLSAGTRFTHYLWSTGDTTENITVRTGGTYAVQVTDIFGFTSTDTVIVNKPVLHVHDTAGCYGYPVVMSAALGPYYQYAWSTGDTTESIPLTQAGEYWLEITDSLSCNIRDTLHFAVDSFAVVATLGPDHSACRGEILGLEQGQSTATGYAWSTGSGDPQILINNPPQTLQEYSVTVTNINGCVATDTVSVFVRGDAPGTNFRADSVCPGLLTSFTDLTVPVPPEQVQNWLWAFGDGDSSALQHPQHLYTHPGTFYASLTVTTDSGCFKTFTRPVIVWSNPEVHFGPVNGCNNVPVPFQDQSSNNHGSIQSWYWDFGDSGAGDTANIQDPTWNYTAPGNYEVTLVVTGSGGCTDSLTRMIEIRESPLPGFTVSKCCLGEPVYFMDTTLTHPWTEITDRKWFFGDGDSSALVSPSHVYNAAGSYNVTLEVRSLNGCRNSITVPVVVNPEPTAGISQVNLCVTLPQQLTDSSFVPGDLIDNWAWTFNQEAFSFLQNPWFTPDSTGPVEVQLIVSTTHGCRDTTSRTLMVYPLPTANFIFDPEFGTAPLTVNFTNMSSGDASWSWDFGDGGVSTQENPAYTFNTEGIFPVTLTVTSPVGCPHSVTKNMYVIFLVTDIAVTHTQTTLQGSTLGIHATLLNNGTRNLESLILKARFNGSNTISETWNGLLKPGELLDYTFNAGFELIAGQEPDYTCAEAEVAGATDDRPENNFSCDVLNEVFSVSNPYPNPVSGTLSLDIILPFSDVLNVSVFNEAGKKMAELFNGTGAKGYSRYDFDASALGVGNYAIKVEFRGKQEVRKFVKR